MRPINIPKHILKFLDNKVSKEEMCAIAKKGYSSIKSEDPDVSIVIPAYNESENIAPTLASLCNNKTNKRVEIIVVNNNSTDDTELVVKNCGIDCILELNQGIPHARNAGLRAARGRYVLNADADTLYPEKWIDLMVRPLVDDSKIVMTYGRFSFIPIGDTGRRVYFFYEHLADFTRWLNKYIKDEAVNVYGFSSALRKEQALEVGGYEQPNGAVEDGYMALKLKTRGLGELHNVTNTQALVWTTDRRIQIDGGLYRATLRRIKRVFFKGAR